MLTSMQLQPTQPNRASSGLENYQLLEVFVGFGPNDTSISHSFKQRPTVTRFHLWLISSSNNYCSEWLYN